MKKLVFVLATLFAALTVDAQTEFGINAGMSSNWIPGTATNIGARRLPRIGFYAGANVTFSVSESFIISPELQYIRKGYKQTTELYEGVSKFDLSMDCIQMPIFAGYRIPDGRLSIKLGPEFAYILNMKYNVDGEKFKVTGGYKPFQFLLALQFTFMFTERLGLDLKADYGFTRVFEDLTVREKNFEKGHSTGVNLGLRFCFGER